MNPYNRPPNNIQSKGILEFIFPIWFWFCICIQKFIIKVSYHTCVIFVRVLGVEQTDQTIKDNTLMNNYDIRKSKKSHLIKRFGQFLFFKTWGLKKCRHTFTLIKILYTSLKTGFLKSIFDLCTFENVWSFSRVSS